MPSQEIADGQCHGPRTLGDGSVRQSPMASRRRGLSSTHRVLLLVARIVGGEYPFAARRGRAFPTIKSRGDRFGTQGSCSHEKGAAEPELECTDQTRCSWHCGLGVCWTGAVSVSSFLLRSGGSMVLESPQRSQDVPRRRITSIAISGRKSLQRGQYSERRGILNQ